MGKWIELKEKEKQLKEHREQVEADLYSIVKDELPEASQKSFEVEGYKLTIKPNFSVSVDQEAASSRPELFKLKYEMTFSQYQKSTEKRWLDDVVTIKNTKPTFSVTFGDKDEV